MSGEYPTSVAMALWIGCKLFYNKNLPQHMIKKESLESKGKFILLYNNFKGFQHSFILLSIL